MAANGQDTPLDLLCNHVAFGWIDDVQGRGGAGRGDPGKEGGMQGPDGAGDGASRGQLRGRAGAEGQLMGI